MRNVLTALFFGTLLCAISLAQNTPPSSTTEPGASQAQPSTPAGQPRSAAPETQAPNSGQTNQAQTNQIKIAPGSVIPVQLAKTVEAKKAKAGDEVVATVTQDMKTTSGDVLVPKDTKIVGHVTEAQARNKEQKESQLGIAFDHAVVKGDQMTLPMSIQAIIAPRRIARARKAATMRDRLPHRPQDLRAELPPARRWAADARVRWAALIRRSSRIILKEAQPPLPSRRPMRAPPITGNTQGVIGMPDVKLDNSTQAANQGSVVSSEKNNVKIEKGTLLLLRVNQ